MSDINVDIDDLRNHYLMMPPYEFDTSIPEGQFTEEEKALVRKYGKWLDAIWTNQIPLVTEKLKHFAAARDPQFNDRTKIEDLWYRYKNAECPF